MLLEPMKRVVSGMRPTGSLHLGHYHSVLKNWARLQDEYQCFYFVADWHALTTDYKQPHDIEPHVWEMVLDWLIAGIDPEKSTLYIQSQVPEHAELNLLLAMITPLGWLERVPSYKDQLKKLQHKELGTLGFLGYPVLQAADILLYQAHYVPVGEDQVPHVELTREIARRVNHFFGKEPNDAVRLQQALNKVDKRLLRQLKRTRTLYLQKGDEAGLNAGEALIADQATLTATEQELLGGYLRDQGRRVVVEPEALLTEVARVPGTDGQKMSKSLDNTIAMRDDAAKIEKKLMSMPTDPNRKRLSDPGEPEKCPIWQFHQIYSSTDLKEHIQSACRKADIGCVTCKKYVVNAVLEEQHELSLRARRFANDRAYIRQVMAQGCVQAREAAAATMAKLRKFLNIDYY